MAAEESAPPTAAELRRAGAVHDVNQMLTAIIGRAQLALARRGEQAPPPALAADLRAVLVAARDAVSMLQRLRGIPAAADVCDVRAELAAAADLMVPPDGAWRPAGGGGWTLENRVPAGCGAALPPSVLREVAANLLRNALDVLTDGGAVTLAAETGDGVVRVAVADDGPGLAAGRRERIFEPGWSTSGQAGRGIGLAACRQLLRDHGGDLAVADDDGCGATFIITAPAAQAPAAQAEAGADVEGEAAADLAVLVVDDEPAVRNMLQDVLGALGCRVAAAADAARALESFVPGGVHLALVDLSLPGLDGRELVRRLRAADPDLVTVLMTGLGNERALSDIAAAEVDRTLTKPLDVAGLPALLRESAALHARRGEASGRKAKGDEPS